MVSLKLIELLEGNTYKVWHDFGKEDVSEKELEEVVERFFGRGKIIKTESEELYTCLFDDEELLEVWDEVEIWENCSHSYLELHYEGLQEEEKSNIPLWDLIERECEFAYKGYRIDNAMFKDYVFEYLGFE